MVGDQRGQYFSPGSERNVAAVAKTLASNANRNLLADFGRKEELIALTTDN